ncbi:caveolae-associated protein 4-like [Bombus pascuorum]|uniref:caveolae-associated protein 4-like n=1 Tax=Bombus pascuorum TaxID=65598 RepID=UPI00298D8BAA|nr:caveolae-associated protein 4-like [Bombus pascuorum]
MSEKLAAKHTNSVALKKHKLLLNRSESRSCCPYSRPHRLAIFCIITCCIFILYWIILSPLLIGAYHSGKAKNWPSEWFILNWIFAFLIWLFIMLCLLLIWKCFEIKHYDDDVKLQSYGTNDSLKSGTLINTKLDHSQNVKLKDTKQDGPPDDSISDKDKIACDKSNMDISDKSRHNKVKKHKDLPPLVIHRRNSGNEVGRIGTINMEKNVNKDEDIPKSGNDTLKNQRESMKDYLKLVAVTPQDELDTKSPKGSLSPRELFFIDLIREAEKAEQNRTSNPQGTEGNQFFPSDFSLVRKDVNEDKREKQKPTDTPTNKQQEVTYFIADVKSPKREKNEVYLEIEPDQESAKKWCVCLNNEKPILVLQADSKDDSKN